jgi:hypothetical protein
MNEEIKKMEEENQVSPGEKSEGPAPSEKVPEWVSELDNYPLREKEEDPKWAVRTVWIWLAFAMALTTFFIILLILGAIYD